MVYYYPMRLPIWLVALASLVYAQSNAREWRPLFDGASLRGWREAPFRYHGGVRVENGSLVLGAGPPLTGVSWTGSFPKSGYEVRFEAERLRGGDFFASLTFPVGDSFCTWVIGGWGGDTVGLSNIDDLDASENETRILFNFERARWYRFRLAVTLQRIQAWIEDRRVIDILIQGRSVRLRSAEMEQSAPLGFLSYNTEGAIRNVAYRLVPPAN
jgi:hypothetical protein